MNNGSLFDSKQSIPVVIKNQGPVAEFAFELRPGVNVLTGPNGCGKTNTIDALAIAFGVQQGRLNVREGSTPDAAVVTVAGEPAAWGKKPGMMGDRVHAAPRSVLVDFLTGGGLSDPKRAEAARIKALAELVPDMQRATAEDVAALIGDAPGIDPAVYIGRPVLECVDLIKSALQERARNEERLRDEANGSIATTTARLGALKTPDARPPEFADALPVRDAEQALSDARQRLQLIQGQAERRSDLERVAATRGEPPNVLDAIEKNTKAKADVNAIDQQMVELQCLRVKAVAHENATAEAADRAIRDAEQWSRQAEALAGIDALPDAAQVNAAQEALQTAQERADLAERASAYLAAENAAKGEREALAATLERVQADAKNASERADALRTSDRDIAKRLSALLASKGLPAGLTVKDGRVHVETDGKAIPFGGDGRHLSEGQQVKVMLDLARVAYPGRVVFLDAAWWAALAPALQSDVGRQCAEAGIAAVTAKPTDADGMAVEIVDGGVAK